MSDSVKLSRSGGWRRIVGFLFHLANVALFVGFWFLLAWLLAGCPT